MATHDYDIANQSGAAFRTDLNNALAAIQSNNSNSSSPSTTVAYQWWADTTDGVLKIRNSSNNAWVELLQLDGTLTMETSTTASAPSLAFRGDLDTGIFQDSANHFQIATAGVERVEFQTTEVVFNDGGNDIDFRIEGDTQANLFKLDAGDNRIGVAIAAPRARFDLGNIVTDTTALTRVADRYQLVLEATDSSARFSNNIGFILSGGSTVVAAINTFENGGNGSTGLSFATSSNSSSDPVEAIRIEGDGDIGLLTTTPNLTGFSAPIVSIGKSANPYSVLEMQGNNSSDGAFGVIAGYNSAGSARVIQLVMQRNNSNDEAIFSVECARGGTLGEVARFTNTSDEKRIIVGGTDETNTSGESSWMGLKLKGARPYLVFHEDDRSGDAQHGFVAHTTGALFVAKMAGRIAFSTSSSGAPTEQITFDASGNIYLGATSNTMGGKIEVTRDVGFNDTMIGLKRTDDDLSNRTYMSFRDSGGTQIGSIGMPSASAVNYNTSSDYRLKENVVSIIDGISRLKTLKPCRFNWKSDKTKTMDGFLAHEVTAVPEAISGTKDEVDEKNNPVYQSIDHSKIVPLLVAAVKELITKVETLEAA